MTLLEERTKKMQQYRSTITKIKSDLKKAKITNDISGIKEIIKKSLDRIEQVELVTI